MMVMVVEDDMEHLEILVVWIFERIVFDDDEVDDQVDPIIRQYNDDFQVLDDDELGYFENELIEHEILYEVLDDEID